VISQDVRNKLLEAQRNEISEYITYSWLAKRMKDENNRETLNRIGREEIHHSTVLKISQKVPIHGE